MDLDRWFYFALLLLIISATLDEILTFAIETQRFSFLIERNPLHFLFKVGILTVIIGIYILYGKDDFVLTVLVVVIMVVSLLFLGATLWNVLVVRYVIPLYT